MTITTLHRSICRHPVLAGPIVVLLMTAAANPVEAAAQDLVRLRGAIVDADTGKPLPARLYIQGENGAWYFPRSDAADGSAVPYRKQRPDNPRSVEMHTALSAHPFVVELPPGKYTLTAERGKEYLTEVRAVTLSKEPIRIEIRLKRWSSMHEQGWFSGDTHVHLGLDELPAAMLADDLNVAFPLIYWVRDAYLPPSKMPMGPPRDPGPKPVIVDATHVYYPRNTEYEIFTVDKKRHTLGAFFVLNHRTVFEEGTPPVRPIAEKAHRQGGLIELDKHNWPWSMMLVPIMKVDLFELSNNHVWRTEFGFPTFGEPAAAFMQIERNDRGFTERGWLDYGFRNWYTLLNCGFRLRPTAGTATGVHPVPLGFGRVCVHCPEGFSYETWLRGLDQGRSFVTTGPMLQVRVNNEMPGHTFKPSGNDPGEYHVQGTALGSQPLDRIEIVVNGEVTRIARVVNRKTPRGGYESVIDAKVRIDGSSWLAVRCFEDRPDRRIRFAHTAPFHVQVPGKPLRPRRDEAAFLVKRVEEQIARNAELLPRAALEEYREALQTYQRIAQDAR